MSKADTSYVVKRGATDNRVQKLYPEANSASLKPMQKPFLFKRLEILSDSHLRDFKTLATGHYFLVFSRYFFTMSFMASSKREPKDLSVSTARCFNSLIRSASILVENTFLFPMLHILHLNGKNYNKEN